MTEEMYWMLYSIIRSRAEHCDNTAGRCSYQSVLSMLEYAHAENSECLRQFDYYDAIEYYEKQRRGENGSVRS